MFIISPSLKHTIYKCTIFLSIIFIFIFFSICICKNNVYAKNTIDKKNLHSKQKQSFKDFKNYNVIGIASWYGLKFHGRKTASNNIYNEHCYTAAHRTLPLYSIVKVTNITNGKFINVLITDRGPYAKQNHIIDLSRRAASNLKMLSKGVVKVKIELNTSEMALYTDNNTKYEKYCSNVIG